jgi:hypothetical protein
MMCLLGSARVPLRMSPRALMAIRTDSSWSSMEAAIGWLSSAMVSAAGEMGVNKTAHSSDAAHVHNPLTCESQRIIMHKYAGRCRIFPPFGK